MKEITVTFRIDCKTKEMNIDSCIPLNKEVAEFAGGVLLAAMLPKNIEYRWGYDFELRNALINSTSPIHEWLDETKKSLIEKINAVEEEMEDELYTKADAEKGLKQLESYLLELADRDDFTPIGITTTIGLIKEIKLKLETWIETHED